MSSLFFVEHLCLVRLSLICYHMILRLLVCCFMFICIQILMKPGGFCPHLACFVDNKVHVCSVCVLANKRTCALFIHCFLVKLFHCCPYNTHISTVFSWALRSVKPGSCEDQQIFAHFDVVQHCLNMNNILFFFNQGSGICVTA